MNEIQVPLPAPTAPVDLDEGSIFFIGNATVLIRYAGFTILTDPTFIHMHEETWLGYGLHTTRLTNPAIEIGDLPPLDFVVLSHFHGDHFDEVAERELDHALPIVTTQEAADELGKRGFTTPYGLESWDAISFSHEAARVRVTATPGRHGPPIVDFALPNVMGSVLDFESAEGDRLFRMYITGDTLAIDDLREIPRRHPDIDLALLHLGGTKVMGIMVTMDGRQGVEVLQMVEPAAAIPIHFDDYDAFTSPLSDFQDEVQSAGLADRVRYLERGQTHAFRPRVRT